MTKPEKRLSYPILDIYSKRWSPRAFADKSVDSYTIQQLFEAARWTASAFNEQPWQFHYAKNGSLGFLKMVDGLMPGNQVWASKAPLLIAVSAKKTFDRNGKANVHSRYDTGAAVWSLVTQATELNLFVHQMAGFYPDKVSAVLDLSDNYEPVVMLAIGYLGRVDQLPPNLTEKELKPQTRKSNKEFCFEIK